MIESTQPLPWRVGLKKRWFFLTFSLSVILTKLIELEMISNFCNALSVEMFVANIKSAIKRARQNIKLRSNNASARSRYRTYVKNVLKAVEAGNKELATAQYAKAQPIIDRAAGNGLIHKNKAARIKSRLSAHIKAMAA